MQTPGTASIHAAMRYCLLPAILLLVFGGPVGCSLRGGEVPPTSSSSGIAKKGAPGTKPYTIRGKTYHPILNAHGFREEGIASWYGKDFHGKKTANGERYDMYSMTAAHKLLPFGTTVKVTNKSNGKSIVVRINDRGPFVANRVIDLTRTGAERIGMIANGTAPVRLESVGTVRGLEDGDMLGRFYVQVGAFGNRSNAERLVAGLQREGLSARTYFAEQVSFWRVQVGPYPSLNRAEQEAAALLTKYPGNFVVAE